MCGGMCMPIHVCVEVCIYLYMSCGGITQLLFLKHCPPWFLFWRQYLSLIGNLSTKVDWLSSEPHSPRCLSHPRAGITSVLSHIWWISFPFLSPCVLGRECRPHTWQTVPHCVPSSLPSVLIPWGHRAMETGTLFLGPEQTRLRRQAKWLPFLMYHFTRHFWGTFQHRSTGPQD